ncbi:E3 ubiquitin-protein ligase AMFR like protein [Argiope bruennichi]|uniref:E3 ubiquitin-protein ligase AMFR like protein n=1 Tax=Argiope bruennichi TaxID=94029 RepID=A0A8T0FAC7_ARGBR|nr:E3 ubiquitin-protein ligase AMFR like protein [Argiope bruennichi]
MPSVPFERIPLPSLQTYTTISILLFSCSIYYAIQVTSDPNWVMNVTENANPLDSGQENVASTDSLDNELNGKAPIESNRMLLHKMLMSNSKTKKMYEMLYVIMEEPLCVWTLINMVYCVMILIGKCIQKIVFGDLRAIEQQHIKDKFWNFVFYKFIFIFGVMNVQFMDEVVMWCGWFSFVGAFHLLSILCKDRFEYLSFSPTTPKWAHFRLFSLIFFILAVSVSLCTIVGLNANLNIFFFMAAEWALVIIRTIYVLVRYVIHLYDITHEGVWEKRSVFTYYCELICQVSSLIVDILHHLHMLLWRNLFISVASLVICVQLRCFFNELQQKIARHNNYLRVSRHLERHFPLATKEELDANTDDCAICWDKMETARKLPCGHLFHTSCLHSWLEQVTNCPTCRTSLVPKRNTTSDGGHLGQDPRQPTQTTNRLFHFDGSRYVSWLPSFSVEVSHTSLLGERPTMMPARAEYDAMVDLVLAVFPHMPYSVIHEDLQVTHSVEQTLDNILEGRLVAPVRESRSSFSHAFHPAPLTGMSAEAIHLREPPSREGGESSDSGVSDNTVRTEESTIVTGAEGCRFSKNSQERETMLSRRKEELIRKQRSKYIYEVCSTKWGKKKKHRRCRNGESSSSE